MYKFEKCWYVVLVIFCWVPVGCVAFMPMQSLEHGELRFEYPVGEFQDYGSRPMGATPPPDCGDLYDVGQSREWADCMGVGYK